MKLTVLFTALFLLLSLATAKAHDENRSKSQPQAQEKGHMDKLRVKLQGHKGSFRL